MVKVGEPAPDFTLQDQDGNNVSISGLKGTIIVLYFYPKVILLTHVCCAYDL